MGSRCGAIDDPCGAIADFCGVIADFCGGIADPSGVVAIPEAIGGRRCGDAVRLEFDSSLHSGRSLAWDHVRGDIDDPCGDIADFCGVIADPCGAVVIPEADADCCATC